MNVDKNQPVGARQNWVEPQIRELDVRETSARPGLGADVGGNLSPDSQFS